MACWDSQNYSAAHQLTLTPETASKLILYSEVVEILFLSMYKDAISQNTSITHHSSQNLGNTVAPQMTI